jgi:hypothetical protein
MNLPKGLLIFAPAKEVQSHKILVSQKRISVSKKLQQTTYCPILVS